MSHQRRWAAVMIMFLLAVAGCGGGAAEPQASSTVAEPAGPSTTAAEPSPSPTPAAQTSQPVIPDDSLAQGAVPPSSNVDPNGYSYTVEEYLAWIIRDLDSKWTPWFLSRSYLEPQVQYVVVKPGQTFTSLCTNIPTLTDRTPNAYYCPADNNRSGTIWLPVTTFQKMWNGDVFKRPSARVGDFAAAIITAHEFGHHVADELKVQSEASGKSITPILGKNKELIADCFAGVWASTAYSSGILEAGDFEEAVAALNSIGDNDPNSTDPHGTSAERVAALNLGYNQTADPTPCVNTYWR